MTANAILMQLYQPLNLLGTVYREITQGLVDMEAMFRLLNRPQEVKDKPGAKPLIVTGGEIRFDNVVFAYDPERIVLKGISFTVPAGKTVAVVGPSGAGKSTISRILYRFYDIKSGSVTIDGQDIRDVTQASCAPPSASCRRTRCCSTTPSTTTSPMAASAPTRPRSRKRRALAQIDKFIVELPQGYESMVGERGLKLSGGEKQRVAIARTILKNPPICCWTRRPARWTPAPSGKSRARSAMFRSGRTTLVIAHRLSTVIDADEILVLDHGRIIERGRHSELLALNGHYASMWNKQREAAAAREKLKEVENDPDVAPGIARASPGRARGIFGLRQVSMRIF